MKITDILPNPENPRVLRDEKFAKLKQSIQEFPKMMSLRTMCKALAKPYPKKEQNAALAHKGEQPDTNREGAFDSTVPLQFIP